MVEDIIFNLSNNIDILETNKRIIAYKGTSSNAKKYSKLAKRSVSLDFYTFKLPIHQALC